MRLFALVLAVWAGCAERPLYLPEGSEAAAPDLATPDLAAADLAARDLAADLAGRDLAGRDLDAEDLAARDLATRDLATRDLATRDLAIVDAREVDFGSCMLPSPSPCGFSSAAELMRAAGPVGIAAGDFDGDHKADLLVGGTGGVVSLLRGNGDRTFVPALPLQVGGDPFALAVGDFDRDGNLDFAASDYLATTVSVWLGRGNDTFAAAPTVSVGFTVCNLVVTDFDRDGNPDLALSPCPYPSTYKIAVAGGRGDGSFAALVAYPVQSGGGIAFTAGDINGDGWLDLSNGSQYLLNDGAGGFQMPAPLPAAGIPVLADFDGDGKADLAVAGGNGADVYRSLGTSFGTPTHYSLTMLGQGWGSQISSGAALDFDGDGKLDLAFADDSSDNCFVAVLRGDGMGGFTLQGFHPTGVDPDYIAVADFDGDGSEDIAESCTRSGSVSLSSRRGDGELPSSTFTATGEPFFVGAGDFDGDGRADVVGMFASTANLAVWLQAPNGSFRSVYQTWRTADYQEYANGLVVGDVNRDGRLDLLAYYQTYLGRGDGTFDPPLRGVNAVALGDFDEDGIVDALTPYGVAIGHGDGTFTLVPAQPLDTAPTFGVIGDLNHDGHLDAVIGDTYVNISAMLGDGHGGLSPSFLVANRFAGIAGSVGLGDFNCDGNLDIAATSYDSTAIGVAITLGIGDGTFGPIRIVGDTPRMQLNWLLVGDFNRDGTSDVVVSENGGAVDLFLGRGDGTLLPAVVTPGGAGGLGLAANDFDRDGRLDVLEAHFGTNVLSVLHNDCR